MTIPLVHKTPKETKLISSKTTWYNSKEKETFRLPSKLPLENAIEIVFPSSRKTYFLVFLLSMLWLPVVLYLVHTHCAVTAQLQQQCSTVDLLKIEVKQLMLEVKVLKSHLSSAVPAREHADGAGLVFNGNQPNSTDLYVRLRRRKRSGTEERLHNMKGVASPSKKSGGTRGGNQSRSMLKKHQGRQRHLGPCCRPFRKNHTKHGGLQAVHLKGAHPEALVESGRIGPWYVDTKAILGNEISSTFQLREDGESVEIQTPGLYLVYAQVYYLTTEAFNSFSIVLLPKDSEIQIPIALCSTTINSISSTSEVTCYTAILRTLQMGDRIIVQQREKQRRLIMRGGHTFLGFAKLSGPRATSG